MKKVLFFVIICMLFMVMGGCNKKVTPGYISAENIYNGNGENYLIYFEKENCSQCAQTLPTLIEYQTQVSRKGGVNVYRVLLEYTDENGEVITLPISRAVENGDTGQGPSGNFYVDGVSNWIQLHIAATPSLIEVKAIDGVKQSKLVAVGTTEIETYLNDRLK